MSLPENLPISIDGPSAWIGSQMTQNKDQWLHILTAQQISELETATSQYLALGKNVAEITAEEFPLPLLGKLLFDLRQALLHGCGFSLLRGLPVAHYSQEFCAALFCGVGAHLGGARSQNAQGHILGHVKNIGKSSSLSLIHISEPTRPY